MSKCLVTGVAGFIGSHLAERLVNEGHEVIGVDCFADYYLRAYKENNLKLLLADKSFKFYEADLVHVNLAGLVEGVDYVFHEAAQAGVRASWGNNFKTYVQNNVIATQRLIEAVKEAKLKRFVYASSSSVYGNADALSISEEVTPRPISPYGVTKLAGEHLCHSYLKNFDVPVIILRYFSVYGPRQRPDMALYRFIKAMLKGDEIVVYGDGDQTRDFTFVDDVVDANVLAMHTDVTGAIFNIGSGSRITINRTTKMLKEIIDKDVDVKYISDQKGDVRHVAADISKSRKLLGYKPKVKLMNGFSREIEWLKHLLISVCPKTV